MIRQTYPATLIENLENVEFSSRHVIGSLVHASGDPGLVSTLW